MMSANPKKRTSMRLNACPRCGGSAYLEGADEDEWRCLQCATVPAPRSAVGSITDRAVV